MSNPATTQELEGIQQEAKALALRMYNIKLEHKAIKKRLNELSTISKVINEIAAKQETKEDK